MFNWHVRILPYAYKVLLISVSRCVRYMYYLLTKLYETNLPKYSGILHNVKMVSKNTSF